ncbi:tRNA 2-thiouridine(34) synthase MnmA [Bacteroidales bacterium OttesenSCG-928-I21]|nr:tRNA 2-thiouridine(34) synthase MnmA [Bacteroidales bacterium OttesenSCG-928-I21]
MKKILLAMSGGIDSSVAAILLRKQNYDIHGITFVAYHSDENLMASFDTEENKVLFEARKTAEILEIPHTALDLRYDFKNIVIQDFINQYLSGFTPNPCVVCNKKIKWEKLLSECNKLNCDYLATGHYAQIIYENGRYFLRKGIDKGKDQTYFLWQLSQENLSRTIFPLGNFTKTQVRNFARLNNYETLSNKSESQEICFIESNDYRSFLRNSIPDIDKNIGEGNFIDTNGQIIGKHRGYPFYTIGQRKGLEIAMGYPVYVLNIDANTNTITLGKSDELLCSELWIGGVNYMKYGNFDEIKTELSCKIRYNTEAKKCRVESHGNRVKIIFDNPVSAITPGQSAVIYENEDVVAGGVILKI